MQTNPLNFIAFAIIIMCCRNDCFHVMVMLKGGWSDLPVDTENIETKAVHKHIQQKQNQNNIKQVLLPIGE